MLVYGIVLSLPGTVLGVPETAAGLGLTLTGRGWLISALFAGLLAGSLLSGPVVDAIGYRVSLGLSAGCVAALLPLLAFARTPLLAGAAIASLGLAAAGMNTASNALASDLFAGERAARMNRLAVLVGIGGVLMPLMTVASSAIASWRTVVAAAGVMAAIIALACVWVPPVAGAPARRYSPGKTLRQFARQPGFVWLAAALLLGGGNEAALAGWTTTYLQAAGVGASASTWILASHWAGLIVARMTLSRRVERTKRAAVVRSALAGAMCIAIFVIVDGGAWLAVMPFVIGLAIALAVPTMLALSGDRYAGHAGALFGLLLTLLQVGGIALPAAIGIVSDRAGLRAGMSLLVVSCLLVAVLVHRSHRADQVESSSTPEEKA